WTSLSKRLPGRWRNTLGRAKNATSPRGAWPPSRFAPNRNNGKRHEQFVLVTFRHLHDLDRRAGTGHFAVATGARFAVLAARPRTEVLAAGRRRRGVPGRRRRVLHGSKQ